MKKQKQRYIHNI
uniref:Uncharacterized protein n=1 Tax=Anguilla anguilla TaxID=7936 RepID=A0A0E9PLR9_ANGAN